MEQLDELYDYKNQLIGDMLTREDIVKLIRDDLPMERAKELVYTQVFPFEYIPQTVQEGHTFICCDVDIDTVFSQTYLSAPLYIWVFTHRSRMKLPEGGVRTDKLASLIADAINGSFNYGLGRLKLHTVKRFAPMEDFQGKVLIFKADDFNNLAPINKKPPANRKAH